MQISRGLFCHVNRSLLTLPHTVRSACMLKHTPRAPPLPDHVPHRVPRHPCAPTPHACHAHALVCRLLCAVFVMYVCPLLLIMCVPQPAPRNRDEERAMLARAMRSDSVCLLRVAACVGADERARARARARSTKSKTHKRLHMLSCDVEIETSPSRV